MSTLLGILIVAMLSGSLGAIVMAIFYSLKKEYDELIIVQSNDEPDESCTFKDVRNELLEVFDKLECLVDEAADGGLCEFCPMYKTCECHRKNNNENLCMLLDKCRKELEESLRENPAKNN